MILQIVIALDVLQPSARLIGHEGPFKCHKNVCLNDPKSQKHGFWPFFRDWSLQFGSTDDASV